MNPWRNWKKNVFAIYPSRYSRIWIFPECPLKIIRKRIRRLARKTNIKLSPRSYSKDVLPDPWVTVQIEAHVHICMTQWNPDNRLTAVPSTQVRVRVVDTQYMEHAGSEEEKRNYSR